jgi:hypothetical protein
VVVEVCPDHQILDSILAIKLCYKENLFFSTATYDHQPGCLQDPDLYEKLPEPTDDENDMLDLAYGLTETCAGPAFVLDELRIFISRFCSTKSIRR